MPDEQDVASLQQAACNSHSLNPPCAPCRVIFMGTPAFAVPTLQALLDTPDVTVLGVLTQPDKPAGRGQKLMPPPVKLLASRAGIPVLQPVRLRKEPEVIEWMAEQKPDFLVTVAFGQILPQAVLDIPRFGTVNVHASLLPAYRGPNPIQWAVIQGLKETGITTMLTTLGVDTGPALLEQRLSIGPDETAAEVAEKLSVTGGPLLVNTLAMLQQGRLWPTAQNHRLATHAPKLSKDDAWIDWHRSAEQLHHQIRGQQPWPGAVTCLEGDLRVKIMRTHLPSEAEAACSSSAVAVLPGTVVQVHKAGIGVQTGCGILEVLTVQPAGKKEMPAADWARGLLSHQEMTLQFLPPSVSPAAAALATP
ncbi:MAG: methionyl-tRNA formyltransferase [Candidatus Melainabacteria bacterium]|nr:methionyl-tRNA formyltransferase [Candidatus Melainabacteria bacterium]